MGIYGKPGASALAFVNYSNRINYLGGDIDKKILFSGERIITTWVNQLDRQTLRNFLSQRPINLLIDDGLHAPQSNLNTLLEFKSSAQKGSWIVIEDIDYIFTNFWLQMIPFLDAKMHCQLVKTSSALVFVAKIL